MLEHQLHRLQGRLASDIQGSSRRCVCAVARAAVCSCSALLLGQLRTSRQRSHAEQLVRRTFVWSDGPLLHLLVVLRLANAQLANLQIGQQDRLLHVILVEVEVVAALPLRFHTPRWRFLHRVALGDVPLQQRAVGLHNRNALAHKVLG